MEDFCGGPAGPPAGPPRDALADFRLATAVAEQERLRLRLAEALQQLSEAMSFQSCQHRNRVNLLRRLDDATTRAERAEQRVVEMANADKMLVKKHTAGASDEIKYQRRMDFGCVSEAENRPVATSFAVAVLPPAVSQRSAVVCPA